MGKEGSEWTRRESRSMGEGSGPEVRAPVGKASWSTPSMSGYTRRCTPIAVIECDKRAGTCPRGTVPSTTSVPQLSALPPQQGRAQQPARVAASQLRGLSLARRKSTSPMLRLCLLGWRWLCEENAHNVSKLFNNKKREASTHRHHHWKPALHQQLKIIRQWKQGIGTAT